MYTVARKSSRREFLHPRSVRQSGPASSSFAEWPRRSRHGRVFPDRASGPIRDERHFRSPSHAISFACLSEIQNHAESNPNPEGAWDRPRDSLPASIRPFVQSGNQDFRSDPPSAMLAFAKREPGRPAPASGIGTLYLVEPATSGRASAYAVRVERRKTVSSLSPRRRINGNGLVRSPDASRNQDFWSDPA